MHPLNGPVARWTPRAILEEGRFRARALLRPVKNPQLSLVSARPVILHSRRSALLPGAPIYRLLRRLRRTQVDIVFSLSWNHDHGWKADQLVRLLARLQRRPNCDVTILANTREERQRFLERDARCLHFNELACADESVYRPLPDSARRFRAVYDAALVPFKRHRLAAEVSDLALVTGWRHDPECLAENRALLERAHMYNSVPGSDGYAYLNARRVNEALNECSVGLCLSAEEGAMRSSGQYLMAGLPVVSTPSLGGRDEFYDPDYAIVVDPTPGAVARGVDEMIRRDIDPQEIRDRTLAKMEPHRRRFRERLAEISHGQGTEATFDQPWPELFGNRLHLPPKFDGEEAWRTIRAAQAGN